MLFMPSEKFKKSYPESVKTRASFRVNNGDSPVRDTLLRVQ
jgi:hypothetical protein